MEIIFQAHNTSVSPRLQARAERAVAKVARRVPRATDAQVKFETDGPEYRVELLVRAPGRRAVSARGRADSHEDALQAAIARLETQFRQSKRAYRRAGQSDNGPFAA